MMLLGTGFRKHLKKTCILGEADAKASTTPPPSPSCQRTWRFYAYSFVSEHAKPPLRLESTFFYFFSFDDDGLSQSRNVSDSTKK